MTDYYHKEQHLSPRQIATVNDTPDNCHPARYRQPLKCHDTPKLLFLNTVAVSSNDKFDMPNVWPVFNGLETSHAHTSTAGHFRVNICTEMTADWLTVWLATIVTILLRYLCNLAINSCITLSLPIDRGRSGLPRRLKSINYLNRMFISYGHCRLHHQSVLLKRHRWYGPPQRGAVTAPGCTMSPLSGTTQSCQFFARCAHSWLPT